MRRVAATVALIGAVVLGAGCDVNDWFEDAKCVADNNQGPHCNVRNNDWYDAAAVLVGERVFSVFPVYPGSP